MITAPNAPPPDVPMIPGSASGLRKMACMMVPAIANAAPTLSAMMTLGIRTFSMTAC